MAARPVTPPRRAAPRRAPETPQPAPTKKRRGGRIWRWRRWFFGIALLGFAVIAGGLYYLSRIPLPTPAPLKQTTFVYDATGKHVLASFSEENRVNVSIKEVPQVVINAVVSTEDRHFFTEGALNPVSIVRAFISDVRGTGTLQGASTITQQYVKQTYLSSERTLTRKIREAALAIRVARSESKLEILQNYLNTIYWGRGAYGVQAASQAYFGKNVNQLGLPEASLLAALIRAPESTDPAKNPVQARINQTQTLKAMERDKKITAAEAARVQAMSFSSYVVLPSKGAAPDPSGASYFVSAVRQQLDAKYGQAVVDSGGLRVTTTLDPTLQAEAYNAVYGNTQDSLNPPAGEPSGALVSIDGNGDVKALVGGQNYKASTVDLALGTAGGGSGRQAGSTFKAFMLAYLIKAGYSVLSTFPAPPEVVFPHGNTGGTPWQVTNFKGETVSPTMDLVDAFALSVNTVWAQVVDALGAANLDQMGNALGIKPSELHGVLSEVLGTADVSPLEMAAAYATFANQGVYHAPLLITRVTTADGKVLALPVQPRTRVVLTSDQATVFNYVAQQVVLRGTGAAAGDVGTPVAGKTGTTENSTDAWFIGYTPHLTTAVWMGYAAASKSMDGFRGINNLTGGTIPAQLWHDYMAAALTSYPQYASDFPPAYNLSGQTLNPPSASGLQFPLGLGTTTTTSPPTTTPSTSTTAAPSTSTGARPTTIPATTVTTVPRRTTPATTHTNTTQARG
jgi:penicillin-binding protein 1A